MKKKIIGMFVCILMISIIVIPVTALSDRYDVMAISYDVDLPIWEEKDSWTYHFTESRTHGYNYSFSGDITLKVVDDSSDSYILEGKTKPHGTLDLGGFGLKTTRLTSFSMRLQIRKNDLGLESFVERYKGIFLFKIGSITLPVPIQFELHINVVFDPTWVIMPFPLFDGKFGNLSGTEIWHTDAYAHLFWGVVPVFGPQNISIPLTPVPYICSEEKITVQGNSFDVFNVSAEWMDGSRFVSYYSEEVGNVAKEVIYIPYGGGYVWHSLILELKEYSYSP